MPTRRGSRRPRAPPAPTPARPSGGAPVPEPADAAAAAAWLDAERANLVAVSAQAAADGLAEQAIRLSSILFRYLDLGGYYSEALTLHGHAVAAARRRRVSRSRRPRRWPTWAARTGD